MYGPQLLHRLEFIRETSQMEASYRDDVSCTRKITVVVFELRVRATTPKLFGIY